MRGIINIACLVLAFVYFFYLCISRTVICILLYNNLVITMIKHSKIHMIKLYSFEIEHTITARKENSWRAVTGDAVRCCDDWFLSPIGAHS